MSDKSIIIIGAGVAGLAAGCYAQMNGYSSRIIEHHSKPGGVAASWRRGDFLMDYGVHFIMGYGEDSPIIRLYRELGTAKPDSMVKMTTLGRLEDEAAGRSIVMTRDLDKLAADLEAISPQDAGPIRFLIDGAKALRGFDLSTMGFVKPPELTGSLGGLRMLWRSRGMLRFLTGRYAKPIDVFVKDVKDPFLRECFRSMFFPEVPVWFDMMLLAMLADGSMALLKGGCREFVYPIAERYVKLGGQLIYKTTVKDILVEGDKAVGVRLDDGTEHRSDIVISAADGHSTIFKMLGGRYVDRTIKERYSGWKLVRPLLTANYGVALEFPEQPHFTQFLLKEPIVINGRPVSALGVRVLNYGDKFAPKGKTEVQAMVETEWDYWNDLQSADRGRFDVEKARISGEILKRLEAHYPGISSHVEVADVATPYTTWRYTLNHKGAWGGWLIDPKVITKSFRITLPRLSSFYMAGQWVQPGGSVPGCIYSGRNAIELICKRDGKRFVAEPS